MVKATTHLNTTTPYQNNHSTKSALQMNKPSLNLDSFANSIISTCGIERTLDISANNISLVAALLRQGVDTYGIGITASATAEANHHLPDRFITSSILELPFPDSSFQTVVACRSIELLSPDEVHKALQEIHRVTKRYAFLQISIEKEPNGQDILTLENRAWWEKKCFEVGFRKSPAYYKLNPYESLNNDGPAITILLEKIPEQAHHAYPLTALAEERDLHMDMLRETGERSDAHVARYLWAEQFVRQGDNVLDAACGLGYGSFSLAELTKARAITGVDGSEYAINYANLNFRPINTKLNFLCGYLPECLTQYPDGSFDTIISFETLEHVEHPEALLAEFHRLLSPGGRIIVSVPNDWSDETGNDPNPFHLHVYTLDKLRTQLEQHFIPEALAQQIASGCKMTAAWDSWQSMPRKMRSLPIDTTLPPPSEWWLMVGMKDPVINSLPYRESIYRYTTPPDNLLQFERDYRNPWLVRSLLEFHFRASDSTVLKKIGNQVLLHEQNTISADKGAALAVLGYQTLTNDLATSAEVESIIEQTAPYLSTHLETAHLHRFYVSLAYLRAKLLIKIGKFDSALQQLVEVANADISMFSPTLGTKVVNAAFEAGMIQAGRNNIETARSYWKLGIKRAYSLLSNDLQEFVGDINDPLEFPTIDAVEFLDSAVRCCAALRVTAENSYVPLTRLYELTQKNWKHTLEERWAAMQSMETMILERDTAITKLTQMFEDRWTAMQSMEAMIQERDTAIQSMESMIQERDTTIASQTQMIEDRWKTMQSMEVMIQERDQTIQFLQEKAHQQQIQLDTQPTFLQAIRLLLSVAKTTLLGRSK